MQRPTNGLPKPRDRSTEVAGETLAAPQFIELARSIVRGALHRYSLLPHSAGGLRSLSISISIGGCSEKLDANSSYATNNVSVAAVPSCGRKDLFSDGAVVFAGAEERSLRR